MGADKGSSSDRRARRVLIVDDNKDAADLLAVNLGSDILEVHVDCVFDN